jgi:uncharacterized Zn-binding protein involved in type VI secretion
VIEALEVAKDDGGIDDGGGSTGTAVKSSEPDDNGAGQECKVDGDGDQGTMEASGDTGCSSFSVHQRGAADQGDERQAPLSTAATAAAAVAAGEREISVEFSPLPDDEHPVLSEAEILALRVSNIKLELSPESEKMLEHMLGRSQRAENINRVKRERSKMLQAEQKFKELELLCEQKFYRCQNALEAFQHAARETLAMEQSAQKRALERAIQREWDEIQVKKEGTMKLRREAEGRASALFSGDVNDENALWRLRDGKQADEQLELLLTAVETCEAAEEVRGTLTVAAAGKA